MIAASFDAVGATLLDLVGHGIGEILPGTAAVHAIAVRVDQAVEVAQGEHAVAAKDGEGHGTEATPADNGGALRKGGQEGMVRARGTPAVSVR